MIERPTVPSVLFSNRTLDCGPASAIFKTLSHAPPPPELDAVVAVGSAIG